MAAVQVFSPPAFSPVSTSTNYTGVNNGSLPITPVVPGLVYDRFIQIWLENTDFVSASASSTFQSLAAQGILLTNYNGVTHPSEPNYLAASTGEFWGMGDDSDYFMPDNVTSIADLLDAKSISWASYQENMPYDGYTGSAYLEHNYLNTTGNSTYTYYKRKHNPMIIPNNIAGVKSRALKNRNFNDFAVDVNASAMPQWSFITPNLVNDAHDTDVTFVSAWLEYFLVPLLKNDKFNNNRTLILLTFDETETYSIQNTVYTVLLGGAVPANLVGTNDTTFYTHYSSLSSVQNNWGLESLGRQDTNQTVAAVWDFQASLTNYTNYVPSADEIPQLNLTGIFPGPCNTVNWTPVWAPNTTAVGAGGAGVMYNASLTTTASTLSSFTPVNLTALGIANPVMANPGFNWAINSTATSTNTSSASGSGASGAAASTKASSASVRFTVAGGVVALGAAVAALL